MKELFFFITFLFAAVTPGLARQLIFSGPTSLDVRKDFPIYLLTPTSGINAPRHVGDIVNQRFFFQNTLRVNHQDMLRTCQKTQVYAQSALLDQMPEPVLARRPS